MGTFVSLDGATLDDFSFLFVTLLFLDFLQQLCFRFVMHTKFKSILKMKPITFRYGMPHRILFSGKSSQIHKTELAHNFTEAAGFKVYTKLHFAYCEHALARERRS